MFLFVFSVVAYQEYGIKKTLLIRFFIVRIAEVGISIFFRNSPFFFFNSPFPICLFFKIIISYHNERSKKQRYICLCHLFFLILQIKY